MIDRGNNVRRQVAAAGIDRLGNRGVDLPARVRRPFTAVLTEACCTVLAWPSTQEFESST